MTLALTCDCGARFEVEDTLAGQEVVWPDCEQKIKAPAATQPTLRTHDAALLSTVLALVGAFTILGTVAAILIGIYALIQISRNRDRYAGSGFAIFGICAGALLTTLTVLAMGSRYIDLGGQMRRNILGDRVDTSGELEIVDKTAGFRIVRPSKSWGISTVEKLEDPFVGLLQGNNPRACKLLLVHTGRTVIVDVHLEVPGNASLDAIDDRLNEDLQPRQPEEVPFRGRVNRDDDANPVRINDYKPGSRSRLVLKDSDGEDVEAVESLNTVILIGQRWRLLTRVCKSKGQQNPQIYVIRAYGPAGIMKEMEPEVRKVLDSFTILNSR